MKVEELAEPKSTSIRKIIADLGPKGIMALLGAMAITWFLFQGNQGISFMNGPPEPEAVYGDLENYVMQVFDVVPGVEVEQVIIRTETVQETQSSVFGTRAGTEREVVRSVVVIHQGNILAPYEITRTISLLLDVEFHRIELLNLANLGGN